MKAEVFLAKHGVISTDAYANYHYAYALYASYMIAAMRQAEDILDGLYFDEKEAALLLINLRQAKEAMQHYRSRLGMPHPEFDTAETIALKGCRLEAGKLIGSKEAAADIAGMWAREYFEGRGNPFCFEVAVYILFLLGMEVDYGFLERRGR